MRFNQTLIKAFDCPRRGHLLNEHQEKFGKTRGTGPAMTGQAFHEFAKLYIEHCRRTKQQTAFAYAERIINDVICKYPTDLDRVDFEILCRKFVGSFLVDLQGEYYLEQRLQHGDMFGTPDVIWIDRPDFPIVCKVIDYKTSKSMFNQSELLNEIQLPYYDILAYHALNISPIYFKNEYHFIRYNETREYMMDVPQLLQFEREIKKRIEHIKSINHKLPQPGEACTYCEVAVGCPMTEIEPYAALTTYEQAQEMAGALIAMDVKRATIQKLLKSWVKQHGPIEVGGKVYDQRPVPQKVFDPAKTYQELISDGMTHDQAMKVFNITQTNLKNIDPEFKILGDSISAMADEKLAPKWGFEKVNEK